MLPSLLPALQHVDALVAEGHELLLDLRRGVVIAGEQLLPEGHTNIEVVFPGIHFCLQTLVIVHQKFNTTHIPENINNIRGTAEKLSLSSTSLLMVIFPLVKLHSFLDALLIFKCYNTLLYYGYTHDHTLVSQ